MNDLLESTLDTGDGIRIETFIRSDGERVVNVLQYDTASDCWRRAADAIILTPERNQ